MSNRNIADLFGDSAVRTTEENDETNKHELNNNETLEQQNDNNNINVNNNVNDNINGDDSVDKNKTDNEPPEDPEEIPPSEQDDILDFLKVEQEKKVVGFHLDKDVRQAFQKVLGKKPQRGAQSELANRIFRDFFEKRGLL
ncbi:hypothetical protein AB1I81_28260 [Bacillus mobilis]|uniref:Uncharacterized protein n=1 Tax=Bacillus mobilis TaxID=2026190 RepID=A0ABV4S5K9_9BACI